jgi:hypothetical protein
MENAYRKGFWKATLLERGLYVNQGKDGLMQWK